MWKCKYNELTDAKLYVFVYAGKTGRFLRAICSTGVIFLALQCGMQITFTYIPKDGKIFSYLFNYYFYNCLKVAHS